MYRTAAAEILCKLTVVLAQCPDVWFLLLRLVLLNVLPADLLHVQHESSNSLLDCHSTHLASQPSKILDCRMHNM